MSSFYQIAPNLSISDNPNFGNYYREIVHDLLLSVDTNFSSALNIPPFSTRNCIIEYRDEGPMCSNIAGVHFIFLHVTGNSFQQWLYQFSHEYCHHLINGKMTSSIYGLMWFEETVCDLASLYQLHTIYNQWSTHSNQIKKALSPTFREYLSLYLPEHKQLFSATHHPGFLSLWEQILFEPKYHRDHYNAIATKMFPLFVENPSLWKMILYFGDMRNWNSLSDLFEHLHQTADDSYSKSLSDLKKLLLS